jgi:hypothetical protein
MQSVTPRFIQALTEGGNRITVMDAYYAPSKIPIIREVPIVDGSLKVDRNSRSRRSANVTVGDPDFYNQLAKNSQFNPYGVEFIIRTGFRYASTETELVSIGVFGLEEIESNEEEGNLPTLRLVDRAQKVYDASMETTDQGPQAFWGWPSNEALKYLIETASPDGLSGDPLWGTIYFGEGLNFITIPSGAYNGDFDRWKLCEEIAASIGGEIYFDPNGIPTVQPTQTITPGTNRDDAVWTVACGEAGTLIGAAKKTSRENTYNAVMMLGATAKDNTPQPVATVYDLDPQSKTFYGGPFGKKLLRVSNSALTDVVACIVAANEKLRQVTGLSRSLSLTSIANPALEAGDIIIVQFMDGTEELHLIEGYSMSLKDGSMSIDTKTRQYVG